MSTEETEGAGTPAGPATAPPAAAPETAASSTPSTTANLAAGSAASATTKLCANCAAPLAGPYCGQCGQPEKGMIRPLTGMVADLLDSLVGWDSRTWRTLLPLYFRPGFLTNEYLAGRRVRYVTPVRLYLFISVIAFLLVSLIADEPQGVKVGAADVAKPQAQLTVDPKAPPSPPSPPHAPADGKAPAAGQDGAPSATTPTTPTTPTTTTTPSTPTTPTTPTRDDDTPPDPVALAEKIKEDVHREIAAERELERQKKEKKKELDAAAAAAGDKPHQGDSAPAESPKSSQGKHTSKPKNPNGDDDDLIGWDENGHEQFKFNGKPWDPTTNPVKWEGAPDFVNRFLNSQVGKLKEKMPRIKEHPGILFDKLYSLAPQALFVMLPIFALLLKILYLFKRRLYSEHLLVALHSHSFLCLSVMLLVGTTEAHTLLEGSWTAGVFGLLRTLVWIWIPVHLFWMQKRVYRQGWFFTTLKFGVLGISYCVLLSFGMVGALLVSFLTV